jgi:hypothetical protein
MGSEPGEESGKIARDEGKTGPVTTVDDQAAELLGGENSEPVVGSYRDIGAA